MEFPSTHLRCSVHIDLYALERNLGRIKMSLPNAQSYIALVAADAFGIGIEAAVARLMLSGADAFAVTNLSEAKRIRRIGPGWPVIVLSASIPGEEDFFISNDITPTLSSLEEVKRFIEAAKKYKKILNVHMRLPDENQKISIPDNTQAKEMLELLLADKNLKLEAFCVSASGSGAPEENTLPCKDFLDFAAQKCAASNKKAYVHHGDIFDTNCLPEYFQTSLRAGLVLFGIKPAKNSLLKNFTPEQVLTFRTAVSHIKRLPAGAYVGYSKTYQVQKDSTIALLAVGYGDGLARSAGGRAKVIVRDSVLPLVGIVSMDQAAINADALPQINLSDDAIIIGASESHIITIEDYCEALGISPAEALTAITQRVPRFYTQSNV